VSENSPEFTPLSECEINCEKQSVCNFSAWEERFIKIHTSRIGLSGLAEKKRQRKKKKKKEQRKRARERRLHFSAPEADQIK